ncbi:hypothetical protein BRADI_2g25685v3 [Brachypodium distachyon]|uniref:Uncharacterized protein n=1 Tax=Brachypodium distachyon TaxID=15368 RepID=A0A0Q3G777_BRADI|nr:hypothetical protein BRADI_2g25685v3 [Brachypodium distachyon]
MRALLRHQHHRAPCGLLHCRYCSCTAPPPPLLPAGCSSFVRLRCRPLHRRCSSSSAAASTRAHCSSPSAVTSVARSLLRAAAATTARRCSSPSPATVAAACALLLAVRRCALALHLRHCCDPCCRCCPQEENQRG